MTKTLERLPNNQGETKSSSLGRYGKNIIASVCLATSALVGCQNVESVGNEETKYTEINKNIRSRVEEFKRAGVINCNNSLEGEAKFNNAGIYSSDGKQLCKINNSFEVKDVDDFKEVLKYLEEIDVFKPNLDISLNNFRGNLIVITKGSEVYAYNKNGEHKIGDLNLDNIKNIDLKKLDYSTLFEKISNGAILILLSILGLSLIGNSTKFFLDYKNRSRGSKMEEATRIFGKYFPTNLHSGDFSGSINEKRVNEKELEEIRKILKIFGEVHNKVLNDYIFNCIISGETAESIINRLSTIEERRVGGELKIFVNGEPFVFVIEEIIIKENSPLDKKNS